MTKSYSVVEIFPTLQGEGLLSGQSSIFLRFAGCNQWNGRPEDRSKGTGACAMWCDTDFAKGDKMDLIEILTRLEAAWGDGPGRTVVMTGGEPTLQLDLELAKALKHEGWFTAIETNGTINNPALDIVDHVCVSPKRGSKLLVWAAQELKVVLPGGAPGAPPDHQWLEPELEWLAEQGTWGAKFVQPQDVTDVTTVGHTTLTVMRSALRHGAPARTLDNLYQLHVDACVAFVRAHPDWRLSLQAHKYLGLR